MNIIGVFLADVDTGDVLASWRLSDPAVRERLIIFGAIILVTLAVLIWAVCLRTKHRHHHSRRHHHQHHTPSPAEASAAPQTEAAAAPPEKRHRWGRHRRQHRHRPRNPTLAETGGLPPIRPESPPDAAP